MEFLDAIKNPLHRSALNKFRLGNHQLRIETERYTVLKTPEHLRICSLCQANVVENKCHVMFYCILYDKLRDKLFNEITEKYNFFKDLDERSKILFLFNNIDPFACKSVAAFIFEIMNQRLNHVISKMN